MTKDEALRLALEALENAKELFISIQELGIRAGASAKDVRLGEQFIFDRAITTIKAALEAKDEPVEWGVDWGKDGNSVSIIKRLSGGNIEVLGWEYSPNPPQRKPLTDDEIEALAKEHIAVGTRSFEEFARRIEAAHGIKGEA
jgi:methionine synthase II (cobalamin-independent)